MAKAKRSSLVVVAFVFRLIYQFLFLFWRYGIREWFRFPERDKEKRKGPRTHKREK